MNEEKKLLKLLDQAFNICEKCHTAPKDQRKVILPLLYVYINSRPELSDRQIYKYLSEKLVELYGEGYSYSTLREMYYEQKRATGLDI